MKKLLFAFSLLFVSLLASAQINYTVDKDGSGDFTTLQAAFDKIPKNNKKQVVINLRQGVYKEKLHLDSTKDNVLLISNNKFNTIITYDDHAGKRAPSGDTINTRTSWSFLVNANNFHAVNITFENSSGFNAGQAVAVEVRGDKVMFENCRFLGNQDVLFTNSDNSRQYYRECYIEGTTDFIFGSSTAWFERCHIHSKKNSHITAASTPKQNKYGYVFNECIFTADTAFTKVSLGRPWRPNASVTYLHCYLDRHILPQGWDNWKNPENEKTARYAEYKNYGPGANISQRVAWSKQLTDDEASDYNVLTVMRDWIPGDE
jgi:pectinesterase